MSGSKTRSWVLGTVVVALLVAVASWFLLVSPVLATAGETTDEAVAQEDANAIQQAKITELKKLAADLDTYKAQLAELQTLVPTDSELSPYLTQLATFATGRGVTITAVTPAPPQDFQVATVVPPSNTDGSELAGGGVSDDAAAQNGTDPTSTPTTAAPVPVAPFPEGMVEMPMTITVVGTYDAVMGFVADVQAGAPRPMLVTAVTGTGQKDADETGGRPATKVGDLEVSITGSLYVLPPTVVGAPPTDEPTTEPTPLPAPVPGKNPMVPVGS